jgi:glycosyltransferase involved in cell wall biosynthesis
MRVWIVDPISYSGLAYSDSGLILALRQLGLDAILVGSDSWMLDPALIPRVALFRGTHGTQSRIRRGSRYLRSLLSLVMRSRRLRPDVVHWQFTELPIADLVAMFAIRALGIPQAYTAHELLPWNAGWHHRWLFNKLYRLVDAVVVHNEQQRAEIIRRFHVQPSKVHVAALGDYSLFATPRLPQADARARLGLLEHAPIALFFGSIRPSKGLEVLLEAWAGVVRALPEAILLITGKPYKGLDPRRTIAEIKRLGIGRTVRTRFEQVDAGEANIYYRATDVVVLPYHDIGTSGVLRYAYNSARPVIATSVGEHAGEVVPGETGQLVPAGNPQALADALIKSLADRVSLKLMGDAAKLHADDNLNWGDPAKSIGRVYEEIRRPQTLTAEGQTRSTSM